MLIRGAREWIKNFLINEIGFSESKDAQQIEKILDSRVGIIERVIDEVSKRTRALPGYELTEDKEIWEMGSKALDQHILLIPPSDGSIKRWGDDFNALCLRIVRYYLNEMICKY